MTPTIPSIPRWRGFNLCEMFVTADDPRWPDMTVSPRGAFVEDHFRWISDWGFNFVRLPLSYRWWSSPSSPNEIRDAALEPVDRAVEWAQRYGVHLSINLHHVPGFCITEGSRPDFMPPEPFNLWKDVAARQCLGHHWKHLAQRYAGVKATDLSFDLINEAGRCTRDEHEVVIRETVQEIRAVSPDRLIVIDGWNFEPCPELADLNLIQSCRGYLPIELSHHQAWWCGAPTSPPHWPQIAKDGECWDRARLNKYYEGWRNLRNSGVAVHCGECGAWNRTPHPVFLAWMEDMLGVLQDFDCGWALWNFRGSFGLLDSGREDAAYEDWQGCRLDSRLLSLLQRF